MVLRIVAQAEGEGWRHGGCEFAVDGGGLVALSCEEDVRGVSSI